MANRCGNKGNSDRLYFLDSKITAGSDYSHEIKRCLLLGRKAMTNLNSIFKSKDHFTDKGDTLFDKVKAMVFPVVVYRCESWTIKKAEHQRIDAFENCGAGETLEIPSDSKEIQPVNPKGNQPWRFPGKNQLKLKLPILWLPGVTSWLFGKDPDAGKDWRQEEKRATEDEMVG